MLLLTGILACTRAAPDAKEDSGEGIDTGVELTTPLVLAPQAVRGIVILQVDTLRADRLPMYGYARDTTPWLATVPWVVVHGERAPASWTWPSTASMLTSLEPARHGLLYTSTTGVNDSLHSPTWPGALSDAGWATAVYSGNPYLSAETGLSRDFGTAVLHRKVDSGQENLAALVEPALAWLDTVPASQPFLLHLQPMDQHDPYNPSADDLAMFRTEPIPFAAGQPDGYSIEDFEAAWAAAPNDIGRTNVNQAVVDLYDAQLLGLDRAVSTLVSGLASRGLLEETLVVFTADHGETLDDPGMGLYGHWHKWREELVNLPFLLWGPTLPPQDADCVSMNTDLWPTIAALTGLPPLPDIDGIDLGAGCRTVARGGLWTEDGTLAWIGAGTNVSALQRNCTTGEEAGTGVEESVDPRESIPPSELPEGEELSAALDEAALDIARHFPSMSCER